MINNRQNNRRRGRGGGPRPNGVNTGNDRGNRIDNRARGNASQLHEKYKTLARDAQMQGDRVISEYYLQFADHYFRVLNESRSRFEDQRRGRDDQVNGEDQEDYGDDNDGEGDQINAGYNRDYRSEQASHNRLETRSAEPELQSGSDHRASGSDQRVNSYQEPDDNAEAEAPRQTRGRRPSARTEHVRAETPRAADPVQVEERIEVDRLPPAFGAADADPSDAPADKPKRRGRRPSVAASIAEI